MALWQSSISADAHLDGSEPVGAQVAKPDWLSRPYIVVTIGRVRFYDMTAEQAEGLAEALTAAAVKRRAATRPRPSEPVAAE